MTEATATATAADATEDFLSDEEINAIEARQAEERTRIAAAKAHRAGAAFEDLFKKVSSYAAHFTDEQKAKFASLFGTSTAVASKIADKSDKKKGQRNTIARYFFAGKEQHSARANVAASFADWYASEEGKAHFENLVKNKPAFELHMRDCTNSKNEKVQVPTRGYPLNPAFVDNFLKTYPKKTKEDIEPDSKTAATATATSDATATAPKGAKKSKGA